MMMRLLLRLIAWAAPPADREWIVGDTLEELDHLEAAHGAAEGRRWLRREAWRALRQAAGHRLGTRPRWPAGTVAGVRQELRLRVFRSSPAIAAAVVASVALGVGANSAVYSLFDQFLWRPLPVPEPHRLVNLRSPGRRWGSVSSDRTGGVDSVFSYPLFRDIQREARLLSGVAGHRSSFANIGPPGDAVPGEALFVSGSYFPVLGLEAACGRLLGGGTTAPAPARSLS